MKGLATLVVALLLLGAAHHLAPDEQTLNPQLAQDLSIPSTQAIRTTVTLTQQWVSRKGKTQAYGYTPQGEAVTLLLDDETDRPERMGALSTYEVIGDALGTGRIKVRKLSLLKQIPEPIDTIRLTLDEFPTYDRQVGRWSHYQARLNGQTIQLISQLTQPQQTIIGYWKGDKFVVIR